MATCKERHGATVIRGEHVSSTVFVNYRSFLSYVFGVIQILCGCAALVLIAIVIKGLWRGKLDFIISCYILIGMHYVVLSILAGSFGVAAGYHKTSCKAAANLILSILAAVAGGWLFCCVLYTLYIRYELTKLFPRGSNIYDKVADVVWILLACSLIEITVAVVQSAIVCRFVCLCCHRNNCCAAKCCTCDLTTTVQVVVSHSDEEHAMQTFVTEKGDTECRETQPADALVVTNSDQDLREQEQSPLCPTADA